MTQFNHLADREPGLDLIRFIAIVFILGIHGCTIYYEHFNNEYWYVGQFYKAVSRSGVQIFLLLSGYLLFNRCGDILAFYRIRLKRVFIPFLFFSIVYYINSKYPLYDNLLAALHLRPDYVARDCGLGVMDFLKKFFTQPIFFHLWFMYPLIGMYIAYPFLNRMFRNLNAREKTVYIVIFMCVSGLTTLYTSLLYQESTGILQKFELYLFFNFYGFAFMGMYFTGFALARRYCLLIFIAASILYFWETYRISFLRNENFEDAYNIFTMLQSFAVFLAFKDASFRLPYLVRDIAKYSFGIYLVHALVMLEVNEWLRTIMHTVNPFLVIFLSIFVSLVISYVIIKLLCKIKYVGRLVN